MLEQKLIILAVVIYLALVTSSVLKFWFKGSLTNFRFAFSFLMPIFILTLLISFNLHILKSDFKKISIFKKCFYIIELALVEVKAFPLLHTEVIDILCRHNQKQTEDNPKVIFENSSRATLFFHELHRKFKPLVMTSF